MRTVGSRSQSLCLGSEANQLQTEAKGQQSDVFSLSSPPPPLLRRRLSLSPSQFSQEDFLKFRQANARALGEKKIMSSVIPVVRGNADIPYEEDKVFGNMEPIAYGITDAKPDFLMELVQSNWPSEF